ncbi:MAG: hypothetical protein IJQ72_04095 [Bacilli bacterium]|nr:hypothetical protein [Bacilli bacterium]
MRIELTNNNWFYEAYLSGKYLELYQQAINNLSRGSFVASVRMEYDESNFNNNMKNVVQAIICGHPELFFINPQVSIQYHNGEAELIFESLYDKKELEDHYDYLLKKIDEVVEQLKEQEDEVSIIYALNDYLCLNFTGENDYSNDNGNAYGVFKEGYARCEGFCKIAKLVLDRFNIDNIICTGQVENEGNDYPHAWLAIRHNDIYYGFDFSFNCSASIPNCPCRAYSFLNNEFLYVGRTQDYSYPITDDDSMLFWNQHNGETYNLRDLGNADIIEFRNNYFSIHHLDLNIEIGTYQIDYEIPDWIIENLSPYSYGHTFDYRYLDKLNSLVVYYIND